MSVIRYFIAIAVCFAGNTLAAQSSKLSEVDKELVRCYRTFADADGEARANNLAEWFKTRLVTELQNPVTFYGNLSGLSNHISIRISPDKKIKFYSWDNLDGGTWHTINCLAQFVSADGKIVVQQLNSGNEGETSEFTDSGVYEVNELQTDSLKLYVAFASGTHGSGHSHKIIRVFTLGKNQLEECTKCYKDGKYLVIEYPRGDRVELKFDTATSTITYPEYVLGVEMDGFYAATGKVVTLKFTDNIFKRQ